MKIIIRVLILFWIFPSLLSAEKFRVTFYSPSLPPYYFSEDDPRTGIFKDILSEIGKITDDKFEFLYLPAARAILMFERGEVDLEIGVNPQWRSESNVSGVYTIPYTYCTDSVIFAKGKRIDVNRPEDLIGQRIGVVRGYVYPKFTELFESGEIQVEPSKNEKGLLDMLHYKRFDQILMNKVVAQYLIKTEIQYKDFEIGDDVDHIEVMMRLHPEKSQRISQLNSAITKLKSTGKIAEIYSRYQ